MWLRMSEVDDYEVVGHCHIIHAYSVIEEAMKYYFYNQKQDKLTIEQKLIGHMKASNPDFQLDYLQAKLSELNEAAGLIVVHSVNDKNVAETLLSQGFKLLRFNVPTQDRLKQAATEQPGLDEDDLKEFLCHTVEDMEGNFFDLDATNSRAMIVTNIVHFVLS